jgi:hypothetical protein
MRFRRPEGFTPGESNADPASPASMEQSYYWEKSRDGLEKANAAVPVPSEARLKCSCGENIVKKGIVRNKILLLEEDGSVTAVCPRCSKKLCLFRSYELG